MTWLWVLLLVLGLWWVVQGMGLLLWGLLTAIWHLLFGVPDYSRERVGRWPPW